MTEEKKGFRGFLCGLFKCDASEAPPQCPVLECGEGTYEKSGGPEDVKRCVLNEWVQNNELNEVLVRRVGELSEEYIQTYEKDFAAYGSYLVLNRKDNVCQNLDPSECAAVPGCVQAPAFQAAGAQAPRAVVAPSTPSSSKKRT